MQISLLGQTLRKSTPQYAQVGELDLTNSVSIKPSDMSGEAQPLNLSDSKAVKSIHEMTFEDFVSAYQQPLLKRDDYLDIKYVPSVWIRATAKFPSSHLFLYSYCALSADARLKILRNVRQQAESVCENTGNEAGALWLDTRPRYELILSTSNKRKHFPSWNEVVVQWMITIANYYGLNARKLFVVYSSIVMLDSGRDLGGYRRFLAKEKENWVKWLDDEISSISQFFGVNENGKTT